MPSASIAEIDRPVAFPDALGEPLWTERRTLPVVTFYGIPLVFLVVLAIAVPSIAGRLGLGALTLVAALLLVRARRRSLIETYTLTHGFVSIEQPGGGRIAIPTATVERVRIRGDSVRIEASIGILTLGFLRRQRALEHALEHLLPAVVIEHELDLSSPICAIKY